MKGKKISSEAKQARAEYMREWRKKNKNKVKANNAKYWERKALKGLNEHESK